MNGGDAPGSVDRGGCPPPVPVPVGWQRKVEEGVVRYISPSGTSLGSLEQTRAYLLADGTCKCGLECPLNVHKVFNFDPAATVTSSDGAKSNEGMTKLCNHRRKIVAMATLYRSLESHGLPCVGPGAAGTQPLAHSGIRLHQTLSSKAPAASEPHPPDRHGNARPGQAPSFPHPHSTLFGDVFPSRPHATNGSAHPAFPPEPAPRPYPSPGLPFPPPEEMVPAFESAPWSSHCASPLVPRVGSAAGSPAPTTLSSMSSPGGSGEPSPQRSRPSSVSSEHRPAPRPHCSDMVVPAANALTHQSSNNALPSTVPIGASSPEGKAPPNLLLLHPQGPPSSFPASSLLSAAALASRGRPEELATSTLSSRLLLSVVGGRPPRRQRRSPTVLRLLKDSQLGQAGSPQKEVDYPRQARTRDQPTAGEAKSSSPTSLAPVQPFSSLLSLLGPPASSPTPGLPPLPPPLPPCDGSSTLLPFQDFNSQILSLFGQLASVSSEQTSGSSPQPKLPAAAPPGYHGVTGPTASPAAPCAPPASSPMVVDDGGLGCPLPPDSFPFLGQEQGLPYGSALPPGLLPLGSFPFSLALGPEAPLPAFGLQGETDGGQPLLPLALPSLDLLQQPSGLLASLLALPEVPDEGEKAAGGAEPLLEPFAEVPDALQPLLFPALSAPPALIALNSALLAASLGPSDAVLTPGQPGLAGIPMAPTSTPPATTEGSIPGFLGTAGRLSALMPQLASPLLSATLLGDLLALNPASGPSLLSSPMLQTQQPLLPPGLQGPLGFQLLHGQPPFMPGTNPLACLLQSLQLSPGFVVPEKPVMPSEAVPATRSSPPPALADVELSICPAPPPPCTDVILPSALDPPEPAQQEASPQGQEASGSCSPLKRPHCGADGLNMDRGGALPRGARRGGRAGRRGGRGWGSRRNFNGQLIEPLGTGHCNGELLPASPEEQAGLFSTLELKGMPGRRPSRRGRRRKGRLTSLWPSAHVLAAPSRTGGGKCQRSITAFGTRMESQG
uniref:Methyl-CpG binding domain protein 6 n=1 Tax=Sphenodon punctatus TaxID=8508 RepID=A0A8D0L602_SPHPU